MQSRKQAGFFDGGLSAIVLALSGLFIWSVEANHDAEPTIAHQQQVEQAEARTAEAYTHQLVQ